MNDNLEILYKSRGDDQRSVCVYIYKRKVNKASQAVGCSRALSASRLCLFIKVLFYCKIHDREISSICSIETTNPTG